MSLAPISQLLLNAKNQIKHGDFDGAKGTITTVLNSRDCSAMDRSMAHHYLSRIAAKTKNWGDALSCNESARKIFTTRNTHAEILWQFKLDRKVIQYTLYKDPTTDRDARLKFRSLLLGQMEYREASLERLSGPQRNELVAEIAKTQQAKVEAYMLQKPEADISNSRACALEALFTLQRSFDPNHSRVLKAKKIAGEVYPQQDQDLKTGVASTFLALSKSEREEILAKFAADPSKHRDARLANNYLRAKQLAFCAKHFETLNKPAQEALIEEMAMTQTDKINALLAEATPDRENAKICALSAHVALTEAFGKNDPRAVKAKELLDTL